MPQFRFVAKGSDGKTVDGVITCNDRAAAITTLERCQKAGEIATGLIYVNPEPEDLHARLGTSKRPLNQMTERDLCPGAGALASINASLR